MTGCFESIGQFLGELYKFHLKPEHKPARHAPSKVSIHLEESFKQEIKSLVELWIIEEVTEHTDWVNSFVIVKRDSSKWTRLPMGTVVAKDIFQLKLDAIFIGIEGVTGIADDMVIAGKDEMEHDRNFLAFMEKCRNNNLTLNAKKIQFKQSQVSFSGHCWLKQEISLDPKMIEALNHMEFPPDKETMRSFLGMVNNLNQSNALSAHLCAPSVHSHTRLLTTNQVRNILKTLTD